jgi:hypothetical protein
LHSSQERKLDMENASHRIKYHFQVADQHLEDLLFYLRKKGRNIVTDLLQQAKQHLVYFLFLFYN